MKLLWERETESPVFSKPEGEKRTDVLIIGGGMAGVYADEDKTGLIFSNLREGFFLCPNLVVRVLGVRSDGIRKNTVGIAHVTVRVFRRTEQYLKIRRTGI